MTSDTPASSGASYRDIEFGWIPAILPGSGRMIAYRLCKLVQKKLHAYRLKAYCG